MNEKLQGAFNTHELESFHDEIGAIKPWVKRAGWYSLASMLTQLQREVREVLAHRELQRREREWEQLSLAPPTMGDHEDEQRRTAAYEQPSA